jgi:hypothetical protein
MVVTLSNNYRYINTYDTISYLFASLSLLALLLIPLAASFSTTLQVVLMIACGSGLFVVLNVIYAMLSVLSYIDALKRAHEIASTAKNRKQPTSVDDLVALLVATTKSAGRPSRSTKSSLA